MPVKSLAGDHSCQQLLTLTLLAVLAILILDYRPSGAADWTIVTSPELAKSPAIRAATEDLQATGKRFGLAIDWATKIPVSADQLLVVGGPQSNPALAALLKDSPIRLHGVSNPQGFEIRTLTRRGRRLVVLAGGSPAGDVYGIYWIRDRLQIHGRIGDLDVTRVPRLPIRLVGAHNRKELRNAIRSTATWVVVTQTLDFIPWRVEPEATRNRQNRARLKEFIQSAHGLGLKVLVAGDEISYHPSLLKEFGATCDPRDPALWQALQAKYRRLFQALPELDGVCIRTGELTRVAGNYKAFDVMHEPADCDWSVEKRYRTFVKKMHQVVVGQFHKIYYQRTWGTNTWEQHSDPGVFRRTFTADVPTKNLYLSPYLSLADRWYYQPFNPTFNLTAHKMVVLLSTLDYHAQGGVPVFPSFPGDYYQRGLERILAAKPTNLVGVQFGVPATCDWTTAALTAYTAFRLAWNPTADLHEIAEDFAASHVGCKAASTMADILLLSQRAYKDGIYVKPVAESIRGNTLPHLRLTVFNRRGLPQLDKGKAHIAWLQRTLYEPSRGHIDEAMKYLDRGLDAAVRMQHLYAGIKHDIDDPVIAQKIGDELNLTRCLVATNNRYIGTCYAYFQYRERRGARSRQRLQDSLDALIKARQRFAAAPGFCYHLYGVDQLIENAREAVANLEKAERTLAQAPTQDQLKKLAAAQQARHRQLLASHGQDAVKVLHWRGKVDGHDILHIRGKTVTIEHIEGDPIGSVHAVFSHPLPTRPVTVLIKDVQSRDAQPFLLQQPSAENGYSTMIYLADQIPSYTWWEFEVYYIECGDT